MHLIVSSLTGFVGDVCCWLGIYNPGDRASAFNIGIFVE